MRILKLVASVSRNNAQWETPLLTDHGDIGKILF